MGIGDLIGRCAAGIAALSVGVSCLADPPAVMDLAPSDALAVLGTPSLSKLDQSFAQTARAMGLAEVSTPLAFLAGLGLEDGVDRERAAMVVLLNEALDQALPPVVAVVPVADFGAFVRSLGGEAGGGVIEVTAAGMPMYARDLGGGYAALAMQQTGAEAIDGEGGYLAAHALALGESGSSAVDGAELFLTLSAEGLRTKLRDHLAFGRQYVASWLGRYGFNIGDRLRDGIETALRDATGVAIGARADGVGVRLDVGLSFDPTSQLAQRTSARGAAHAELEHAPGGDYLITYALDTSAPTTKALLRDAMGLREGGAEKRPGVAGGLDELEGHTGVIYPSSLIGGLMARGVYSYQSAEPGAFAAGFQQRLEASAGVDDRRIETVITWEPEKMRVSGVPVAEWSQVSTPLPGSRAAPPIGFLWGAAKGPKGYLVMTGKAMYTTTVADAGLVEQALAAANGTASAAKNAGIRQTAERLADNRAFEAYLSLQQAAEQYNGFVGMVGMPNDQFVRAGENTPPVGLGVSLDGGGMRLSGYVPSETVRLVREMLERYRSFMGSRGGPAAGGGG